MADDDIVQPPTDSAVDPAAPPAAVDPAPALAGAVDPPAAADPPQPAPAPAGDHGNKGQTPWYMKRIAENQAKVDNERGLREAAERRANDAEALARRLQAGGDPALSPAPPQQRQLTTDSPEFQSAVQQEAARQQLFNDSVSIKSAGVAKFGADFGNSLNILTAIGATSDDFVADLISVDKVNAHVLIDKLAKDPEKAATLAGMPSRSRIAELTRMSMAEAPKPAAVDAAAPPAPKPVSTAPKPRPAIDPVANAPEDNGFGDDVSDDQWSKNWDSKFKKRA